MDSVDGPMRVKVNPDGSSTVNMGVKGTFTQKLDMQTKTLRIQSNGVTMEGFADMLTRVMQMGGESSRQVVDKTDLKGYYQTNLDLSLAEILAMVKASGIDLPTRPGGESADAGPDDGQTVLESVQALGLKLEPAQGKCRAARHRQCDEDADGKLKYLLFECRPISKR